MGGGPAAETTPESVGGSALGSRSGSQEESTPSGSAVSLPIVTTITPISANLGEKLTGIKTIYSSSPSEQCY